MPISICNPLRPMPEEKFKELVTPSSPNFWSDKSASREKLVENSCVTPSIQPHAFAMRSENRFNTGFTLNTRKNATTDQRIRGNGSSTAPCTFFANMERYNWYAMIPITPATASGPITSSTKRSNRFISPLLKISWNSPVESVNVPVNHFVINTNAP